MDIGHFALAFCRRDPNIGDIDKFPIEMFLREPNIGQTICGKCISYGPGTVRGQATRGELYSLQ